MTVKTLVCSLCCQLQRARSDETDLKITSPEIICIFSCFPLLLGASNYSQCHIFNFFSPKRVQLKRKEEGQDNFQEVKRRKTATTVSIDKPKDGGNAALKTALEFNLILNSVSRLVFCLYLIFSPS